MPKVSDIKAYFKEIATKAGLSEDEAKQVLGVMDNDKFAKAFTDGFKPLPDYSHDLDEVRTKTKADKDTEYKDWYTKEQTKYNEYLAGLDRLKKYEETFGPIDNSNSNSDLNRPNPNKEGNKVYLTKEEMDAQLAETLARRDAAVLDLLEIRESHINTFKKSLDVKSFEAAWKEHPEWGMSMKLAYEKFVDPEIKKIDEARNKAEADRRYEEGVRDGFSRRAVPADHQPKTFSPMFDQKEDVSKLTERQQEQHSREAFFEGFREANKQPV